MISPEYFIKSQCRGKTYAELLEIREELLEEIREFENRIEEVEKVLMCPSPEVIYQMNLQYLGKLCELIAETYNEEFV